MATIVELISHGEGQTIEFKKSLSLRREGLEALCAMVNAESGSGVVIFGVGPDGTIVGVEPGNIDKAQRTLSQAINMGFDPQLDFQIQTEKVEKKQLIVVTASRAVSVPYYEYDGRGWIREGSEKRQMTLREKDSIRKRRDRNCHNGPWKCDQCGALAGSLSNVTVTNDGMKKNYDCNCGGEFWPST